MMTWWPETAAEKQPTSQIVRRVSLAEVGGITACVWKRHNKEWCGVSVHKYGREDD